MTGRVRLTTILTTLAIVTSCASIYAGSKEAWNALQQLDIPTARKEFASELKKHPDDASLLRGNMLAAFFDLDGTTAIEMARQLVAKHPKDAYLMPVAELVFSDLGNEAGMMEVAHSLGLAVNASENPMETYCGRWMLHSVATKASLRMDPTVDTSALCPGGWLTGPFDNESNVALFRKIEFEGEPLDTLAMGAGRHGALLEWDYVPIAPIGHILSGNAIEDMGNSACQFRSFFELPEEMDINIAFGGSFSVRVLVDGDEVFSDPLHRNATIRESIKVHLATGPHEITLIAAHPYRISFRFEILDGEFRIIPGLRWLRYTNINKLAGPEAKVVHPIFKVFNERIQIEGTAPDTRFWSAILQIYNAYSWEVVNEFESLNALDSLSALERYALYKALVIKEDSGPSSQVLQSLLATTTCPRIQADWITVSETDYSTVIKAFVDLDRQFPQRPMLLMMAACEPILNGDVAGMMERLEKLKETTSGYFGTHQLLIRMYSQQLNDVESAYRTFLEYCDKAGIGGTRITQEPNYFQALGRNQEAIDGMRPALANWDYENSILYSYYNILTRVNRQVEMVPLLDSLIDKHPANIELYDLKYRILVSTGDLKGANQQLVWIHKYKPSAAIPYRGLDSLRNGCGLDSIFGNADMSQLWQTEPDEGMLGDASRWSFLDRRQVILFESGVTCTDQHFVTVLRDQQAVEDLQQAAYGFDPEYDDGELLIARRLRKGMPSLDAQEEGENVYFQDLKPGDAIEVRRRFWSSTSGDLYREFWYGYLALSGEYQRQWEFTLLTNRKDVQWATVGPVPAPKKDIHCGFQRTSYVGENAPAMPSQLGLLPAPEKYLGKIYVSTLKDWQGLHDWYYSVSEAVLDDNPRTISWAEQLRAGSSNKRELVQNLYNKVVLEIPYQVIDFNYDGSIPQRPDDVLRNQWGDCKDKSHLLIKMLRESGVPAWPVLVMTRNVGELLPLPQFLFDHEIIGCLLDGDTLYVDPSSSPLAFDRSITSFIADQLALPIDGSKKAELRRLPAMSPDDSWTRKKLVLRPEGERLNFVYYQEFLNTDAAFRRDDHKGETTDAFRRAFESELADFWELDVLVDSIRHDSLSSTSDRFEEVAYGSLPLRLQKVGSSQILTLPNLSTFARGYPSFVAPSQALGMEIPVDLYGVAGRYDRTIELFVPIELGDPELPPSGEFADAGGKITYASKWDPSNRVMTLEYHLQIDSGDSDRVKFAEFTRKVIDLFSTPILLAKK